MSNAQISPDGARLVYTRQQANHIEDRWDSSLWIMNADGGQHRFLTKGSNPFAAAAVRCPVIDWLSMTGNTDIPLFTYSFFQKPFWDDPSDWLSHSSVMTAGKVTTPTLLMTGVFDRRTPMPQTEEYYAALKVRGVPVKQEQPLQMSA